MELSSNLGTVEVLDGDLDDPRARAALSSGLCGDLALAIHRQTGGAPYFLSYSFNSAEELAEAFELEPNSVIAGSCHVLIESPTEPGEFLDSYGRQDVDSLEDSYDGAAIVPGTVEMLEHFADQNSARMLDSFARSAIELDRDGIRYSQDLDELSWDEDDEYFEEEDGEFSEAESVPKVELQLAFGSVAVPAGDLSDPKTRFYFANGLCGDLALRVREQQGGGAVHFVVDPSTDEITLFRAAESKLLGDHVAHAVVESKDHPGFFIDAYGLKTKEQIEEFYSMELREVPAEYLDSYGSGEGGQAGYHDLSSFARSALAMARDQMSYPYSES